MSEDEIAEDGRIGREKTVELLFNDSSKNVSDLKTRQWTATNFAVLAITAIAVFARENRKFQIIATALMFVIAAYHCWVTYKCHKNLGVFRVRIKDLISRRFCEESHDLFGKEKTGCPQKLGAEEGARVKGKARKLPFPWGKEGQDFEEAVADEGSIEAMLYAAVPVTFIFACLVVWCWP
jgi:hypothetical protein